MLLSSPDRRCTPSGPLRGDVCRFERRTKWPDQMVGIEVFDSRNLEDASLDLTWRSQILRDVKC
jgi:hypothetical protein